MKFFFTRFDTLIPDSDFSEIGIQIKIITLKFVPGKKGMSGVEEVGKCPAHLHATPQHQTEAIPPSSQAFFLNEGLHIHA